MRGVEVSPVVVKELVLRPKTINYYHEARLQLIRELSVVAGLIEDFSDFRNLHQFLVIKDCIAIGRMMSVDGSFVDFEKFRIVFFPQANLKF